MRGSFSPGILETHKPRLGARCGTHGPVAGATAPLLVLGMTLSLDGQGEPSRQLPCGYLIKCLETFALEPAPQSTHQDQITARDGDVTKGRKPHCTTGTSARRHKTKPSVAQGLPKDDESTILELPADLTPPRRARSNASVREVQQR